MSKEICDCDRQITLGVEPLCFYPDEEPYENNVEEKVTEEHSEMIQAAEFYMTATLCPKCKKLYLWDEDGNSIGISEQV